LTSPNPLSTLLQRFACARLSRPYRAGVISPTLPQRSPPSLLATAACGGLRSAPDCRTRRALPHLLYSCASPFGQALLVTQDPKRILRNAQSQERLDISSGSRSGKLRLRRLSKFLQRWARWREERCAGVRGREIEQPVVSARRVADIHSLQHLLNHPKISRIADKIRTELPLPRTTKRHVVAEYMIFVAARIYDGRQ